MKSTAEGMWSCINRGSTSEGDYLAYQIYAVQIVSGYFPALSPLLIIVYHAYTLIFGMSLIMLFILALQVMNFRPKLLSGYKKIFLLHQILYPHQWTANGSTLYNPIMILYTWSKFLFNLAPSRTTHLLNSNPANHLFLQPFLWISVAPSLVPSPST